MRNITFHCDAFEDFTNWAARDEKVFERLKRLIVETARDPFGGIGKPEPLKHELKAVGPVELQTSTGLFIASQMKASS
jgi:toxin YoeB